MLSTDAGLAAEQWQSGTSPLTASRPSESEQTPAEPLVKGNKAATTEPQTKPAATPAPAAASPATASLIESQGTALVPASAPAAGGTAADEAAEVIGQEYCSVLISKLRVSSTY